MAGLKQIKSKIRSVAKTGKVTKAMEAVSAAKMRKTQERALSGRTYARAAAEILARVSNSRTVENHPLTKTRDIKNALYIVITSDKGLAGALNSGVLRAVATDMAAHGYGAKQKNVSVIAIGKKTNEFFSRRGFVVEAFYPNTEELSSDLVQTLVNDAALRFSTGACDTVNIAYQNFVSTFEQRPTLRTMFPLSLSELAQVVNDIKPKQGKFSEEMDPVTESGNLYSIEPSDEAVLDAVLPQLASVFVYHALLESQASEHSARMVAMKSASDKARDLGKELTLAFNKARQAAITREVSEIIGGIEAMAA